MRVECAWCKKFMSGEKDSPVVSHGICEACTKKYFSELKDIKPMKNPGRSRKPEWTYSPPAKAYVLLLKGALYMIEVRGDQYILTFSTQGEMQYRRAYYTVEAAMDAVDHTQGKKYKRCVKVNPGAAYHEAEAEQEEKTERVAARKGKATQAAFHRGKAAAHRQSEAKARSIGMNPGGRYAANIAGVVYNRIVEIKAEKTLPHSRGFWRHPFNKKSAAQILALDNGDLLIHSTAGKRLWKPY